MYHAIPSYKIGRSGISVRTCDLTLETYRMSVNCMRHDFGIPQSSLRSFDDFEDCWRTFVTCHARLLLVHCNKQFFKDLVYKKVKGSHYITKVDGVRTKPSSRIRLNNIEHLKPFEQNRIFESMNFQLQCVAESA